MKNKFSPVFLILSNCTLERMVDNGGILWYLSCIGEMVGFNWLIKMDWADGFAIVYFVYFWGK